MKTMGLSLAEKNEENKNPGHLIGDRGLVL